MFALMQSANAYKLKIGEKRFSAVFYRSPSIAMYYPMV